MTGERTLRADDDTETVARFLRGDAAAFDILFRKYQDYVYNIVYGIVGSAEESRDITQEVFVQVYRALPRFRHGARFATWLYRIAVNRAVDAARAPRRWRFWPILEEPALRQRPADAAQQPEQVAARRADTEEIQAILMRCSLAHRQALALRYYKELSLEEIAEVLDCSVAAAKVRLHRARHAFREAWLAAKATCPEPDWEREGAEEESHAPPITR